MSIKLPDLKNFQQNDLEQSLERSARLSELFLRLCHRVNNGTAMVKVKDLTGEMKIQRAQVQQLFEQLALFDAVGKRKHHGKVEWTLRKDILLEEYNIQAASKWGRKK